MKADILKNTLRKSDRRLGNNSTFLETRKKCYSFCADLSELNYCAILVVFLFHLDSSLLHGYHFLVFSWSSTGHSKNAGLICP